jgi:two-component system sensor histidine kinase VicK
MATTPEKITAQQFSSNVDWSEIQTAEHLVQFYETEDFLINSLYEFIWSGLEGGDACIVLVTPERRQRLEEQLQANGRDVSADSASGQYLPLDAGETLSQFMIDGWPDAARFADVIGKIIRQAAQNYAHVRVFGEMIVMLWSEGHQLAAVHLEQLWNDLRRELPPFLLFCAYPMQDFAGETYSASFVEICQLHSQIIPGEDSPLFALPRKHLRDLVLLQQKAASLKAEVAERKAVEKRLRISENHYRCLFESSADGILIIDPATCEIIDANSSASSLLGCTQQQLLNQPLWHIDVLGDQQIVLQTLQELRERGALRYELAALRAKDGELLYRECVGTLYQVDGRDTVQYIIRDITDRKRAEEAHSYLAAIVASSDDAILSKDLKGIVTSWNMGAELMFGYSAHEMIGQPVTKIFPSDHQEEFRQIMERICQGERVNHYETRRVRKDGSSLIASVSVSPIRDSCGTIIGAADITRDITVRKALEQQREAFVGLVTHELKTPLTALQGNIQLAQRWLSRWLSQQQEAGSERYRALEEVLTMLGRSRHQLQMQRRLINDILDASSMQMDRLELRLAPCDLTELMYATVQEYQAAHPARQITLHLPECDTVLVNGDRDRLQQVLGNYLSNALKFSPSSEPIKVGLTLEVGAVRVQVTDYGPGLSAEQQRRVWERFYQSPLTPIQNGEKKGLGLGLYICQQLVSRQQGQVGVTCTQEEGTTFWFSLPLLSSSDEQ